MCVLQAGLIVLLYLIIVDTVSSCILGLHTFVEQHFSTREAFEIAIYLDYVRVFTVLYFIYMHRKLYIYCLATLLILMVSLLGYF